MGAPTGDTLLLSTAAGEPVAASAEGVPQEETAKRGRPSGGRLRVKLSLTQLLVPGTSPDLQVRDLQALLLEVLVPKI